MTDKLYFCNYCEFSCMLSEEFDKHLCKGCSC